MGSKGKYFFRYFGKKKDFYYFKESLDINLEENYTTALLNKFFPQGYFEKGLNTKISQEGYLCYTSMGIPAIIRKVLK